MHFDLLLELYIENFITQLSVSVFIFCNFLCSILFLFLILEFFYEIAILLIADDNKNAIKLRVHIDLFSNPYKTRN